MDTEALKAFIQVAETQSFSAAAEKLFLTQPAVSKRITSLEASLEHRLFDRLGRRVELTEAGHALLPKAIAIINEIEDTSRSIRELAGGVSGSLRVTTSHYIGVYHLPPVLRSFVSAHPEVKLHFEFLDSEKAYQKVLAGDCEIAVVTLAAAPVPLVNSHQIWTDALDFVVANDHPLSGASGVSLQELSTHISIMPDLNTVTGRIAKRCFDQANLEIKHSMTSNYLETIKMMVSVGLGWSVLPRALVDDQIQAIKVEGIALSRELGIITHSKRSQSNAARAFYELLVSLGHE